MHLISNNSWYSIKPNLKNILSSLLDLRPVLTGLVCLFNGLSTFFRLFSAKAILLDEQLWYYLTHSWENNGVSTFPKGICPKVNVIAWLEYKLAYYDSAVHRFNHYTTRTPPVLIEVSKSIIKIWNISMTTCLIFTVFLIWTHHVFV